MHTDVPPFDQALARGRRRVQRGRAAHALLRLAVWFLAGALALGVLDGLCAFSRTALIVLDLGFLALLVALAARWGRRVTRFSRRDLAAWADRQLGLRRQPILCAYELTAPRRVASAIDAPIAADAVGLAQSETLPAFLAEQAAREAEQALAGLARSAYWPRRDLRRHFFQAALLLLAVEVALLFPGGRLIAQRLAMPQRDLPPFSRYVFTVTPERPAALYGGTLELAATITGAPIRGPVHCLTRTAARTDRATCFEAGGQRYTQRLEKLTQPVDFCFAVGRARSRWYSVELLLEPHIVAVQAEVTPPAYSDLPRRNLEIGREELQGLAGSRVRLRVSSNRPLSGGYVTLRPGAAVGGGPRVVQGRVRGLTVVEFAWELRESAALEVRVRDVRGTGNTIPYLLHQGLTPDAPPEAAFQAPPAFVLATPSAKVAFAGYAEDDLGLKRVDLVRAATVYRDRVKTLARAPLGKRYDWTWDLDLARLGAQPGEALEFFLEARDGNPALTGLNASEMVRVQVIAEEEYARMLRARTTAEEIAAKFRAAETTLAALRRHLAEALAAFETGRLDAAAQQALLDRLRQQTRRAQAELDALAADFTLYDLERQFNAVLAETRQNVAYNRQILAQMKPDESGWREQLAVMLDNVGGAEEQVRAQVERAEDVARIERLMECAGRFLRLLGRQEEVARRLKPFEGGSRVDDPELLSSLGRRQADVRADLLALAADIGQRAAETPEAYPDLKDSAIAFAQAIEALEIPSAMQTAVDAAANQRGSQAHAQAALALERMRQLLSQCEGRGFGGLCRQELRFKVPGDLRATLEQMLQAMGRGSGGMGQGVGIAGMGTGGDLGDGYWMTGSSWLNVPAYGPARHSFAAPASGAAGAGGGSCPAGGGLVEIGAREVLPRGEQRETDGAGVAVEQTPEKYREAIKRYFGGR